MGLANLNHDDLKHDLNHSCLYTLNPLYAKIFDILDTSTTLILFEIVSVFIYSLIKCVVKIEPCYFCFERTTYKTHCLGQSHIV